jgi:hypothetical protein
MSGFDCAHHKQDSTVLTTSCMRMDSTALTTSYTIYAGWV